MNTVIAVSEQRLSRRRFLASTSALGAASFLGLPWTAVAEPPPEITKIRLLKVPAICLAPEYLAEELLHLEGFSEVEYVETENLNTYAMLTKNLADSQRRRRQTSCRMWMRDDPVSR